MIVGRFRPPPWIPRLVAPLRSIVALGGTVGAAVGLSGLNQTTTTLVLAAIVLAAAIQLVCF